MYARAVWRGGVRSYGDCLQQAAQWSPTSCALRPCSNYSCFGQNDSAAAAAAERRACALSASSGTPTEYEHPRDRLLRSPAAAVEGTASSTDGASSEEVMALTVDPVVTFDYI